MIHHKHLRQLIVDPVLKYLDMYSPSASNLMMGTAATESHMGKYLMQIDSKGNPVGPGLGPYQQESGTYQDLLDNYLLRQDKETLMDWIISEFGDYWHQSRLIYDLKFATAMCRVHYWRVSDPLPDADDIEGLARYWKFHFNSYLGKGTVEEFVENYKKYVGLES